jgi:hypothetical protein
MLRIPGSIYKHIYKYLSRISALSLWISDTDNADEIVITSPLNCLMLLAFPKPGHLNNRIIIRIESSIDYLCLDHEFSFEDENLRHIHLYKPSRVGELFMYAPLPSRENTTLTTLLKNCMKTNLCLTDQSALPDLRTACAINIRSESLVDDLHSFIKKQEQLKVIYHFSSINLDRTPLVYSNHLPDSLEYIIHQRKNMELTYWKKQGFPKYNTDGREAVGRPFVITREPIRSVKFSEWFECY